MGCSQTWLSDGFRKGALRRGVQVPGSGMVIGLEAARRGAVLRLGGSPAGQHSEALNMVVAVISIASCCLFIAETMLAHPRPTCSRLHAVKGHTKYCQGVLKSCQLFAWAEGRRKIGRNNIG